LALASKAQAFALKTKASGSASGLGFAEPALGCSFGLGSSGVVSITGYILLLSDFKMTTLIDFQVDGQRTLESNVAEVGGLRIAYTVSGRKNNTELLL